VNVDTGELLALANVLGVAGETKTSAVVRLATERLKGAREYHLECRDAGKDGPWEFVAFFPTYAEAQDQRAWRRAHWQGSEYRIVEMIRRVLP